MSDIEPSTPLGSAPFAPRVEEQLRHAQRLEAICRITGGIAHEFNNLLLAINLNLEALADEVPATPTTRPLFDAALLATEQARDRIRMLLAFSRRQALEPVEFDVNRAVSEAAAMLRLVLPTHIEVATELDAFAGSAFADPYEFATALLNIALNAGDAMSRGGRVGISTSRTGAGDCRVAPDADLAPGDYVLVEVSDNGPGMGEAARHAFEPFFTTRAHAGRSGLGLSQVYGYAKQSGGHAEIDSGPGGTTIRLLLPCRDAAWADCPEAQPPVDVGGETILLVEDAPSVLQAVERLLRDFGYQVLTAAGAAEAIGFIESDRRIDLLFTDIVLPGALGGDELAIVARQLRPGIPVLYTSGYSELKPAELTGDGPPPGLLSKPYTTADLARRLRAVLGRQTVPADLRPLRPAAS